MLASLYQYLIIALVLSFSVILHEVAHGYTAYLLGDNTAKYMKRLSLNPLNHINKRSAGLVLVGLLLSNLIPFLGSFSNILIFIGFVTIAQPVPINPSYFKDPKKGMAITALMGPVTNLVIAYIAMFILGFLVKFDISNSYLFSAFLLLSELNIRLAVLNLIPVPPLDGSKVLFAFLPQRTYFTILQYERYIQIGLLALLFLGYFDMLIFNGTEKLLGVMEQSVVFLLGIS